MLVTLLIVFVIGYLVIALEHPIKIDKTATALLLGMVMWIIYALGAESIVPVASAKHFQQFLADNPSLASETTAHQALQYILNIL